MYFCFDGITPLTPPLGFSISPFLLGIKCIWQCITDCPASLPAFTPTLKAVIFLSKFNRDSLSFFKVSLKSLSSFSFKSKKLETCLCGIIKL